jgi:hypothetical protein
MSFNKKFFTTGGIVASTPPSGGGAFDPLQNFETVTYTGNGSTQKITGYIRKGAAFNGSSSYIDLDGTLANGNTGDFSISMWVNIPNSSSQYRLFATDISPYYSKLNVNIETNGKLRAAFGNGTNAEAVVYTTSTNWANGSWHHLVYTMNWNGSYFDIKFYQNGSLDSSHTTSGTSVVVLSNSKLILGGLYRQDNTTYYPTYLGKQDQVRIFNTALDSGEVTTLYNEDYDSSTKSTTDIFGDGSGVALYELDDDANSSNFEQAAVFNGSSSEIVAPNSLLPSSGGFSISWWQKTTQADNTYSYTMDNSGGSAQNGIYIITHNVSTGFIVGFKNSSVFQPTIPYSSVERTQWTHFCISWDGTTSTDAFKIYKNNVPTSFTSSVTNGGGSYPFRIGRSYNGTDWFGGSIDQVRIYSSALDSTDVEKLYKESADVPTANLVAHYKLDGNATDETETYDGTASNVTYSAGVYGGTPTNVNFLGMAFQPDLVWIKDRDNSNPHELSDSVRGVSGTLNTNNTNAEYINASFQITSLDTNGFTVVDDSAGNYAVNGNGIDYVAWCWKAGGAEVSGTSSHYTNCEISANPDAGFSIVNFTVPSGTIPTTASYNHGLNAPPKLIITKPYNGYFGASSWYTWAEPITTSNYLLLNTSDTSAAGAIFSSVDSSTVKYRFASNNGGADSDVITYNFTDVVGYQKVGSYQGNGSSGGQTITGLGFDPRFLLVKNSTSSAAWRITDSVRGDNIYLYPNLANADDSNSGYISLITDGFRLNGLDSNTSDTFIYLAIA